jgi:hypothetical protein
MGKPQWLCKARSAAASFSAFRQSGDLIIEVAAGRNGASHGFCQSI